MRSGLVGSVSWIVLGMIVGLLANWLVPGRFPGGLGGTIVGGTAGAFSQRCVVASTMG